jgi:acetolactate synthase small subunit
MKILSSALTDPKSKNLMTFIQMNVEELKELLNQPYSLDNAQEVIDLAEAIAEGERKLAGVFRKRLSKDYPVGKGQRYAIIQIAKYYMAYQAGIKDAHTVQQMKDTVAKIDGFIKQYKAYPNNTVEMSQTVNEMEKLWKIVKQFYLDIEEGGLPIIVYQTTNKLDKAVKKYSKLIVKTVGK